VAGSIVMADAEVGEDALVVDSVVGPRALVGAGAALVGVTVGDDGSVPPGGRPPPGTRVECGTTWG
jgi:carbonic anhydrase/acetyltransferase-like protein (isoleucine patch superfamily)